MSENNGHVTEEEEVTAGVIVSILDDEQVKVDIFGDLAPLSIPTILRLAARSVEKSLGI